jgi:hypothetical protein
MKPSSKITLEELFNGGTDKIDFLLLEFRIDGQGENFL